MQNFITIPQGVCYPHMREIVLTLLLFCFLCGFLQLPNYLATKPLVYWAVRISVRKTSGQKLIRNHSRPTDTE